jgi:branched-chain amino acid transport system ATP-binding protein
MLKLRNVQTFYGNIQALKNIDMDVKEGEIITLIGANGAGKSTTLMTLCGVVPPRNGTIEFEGQDITGMPTDQIAALGISQVPEGRRIFPYLTVMENLDMGTFLRKDNDQIQQDLDHVFELFPILAERRNQPGGTLSGGEQQMLAISRAIMSKPRLLLLDEPSLGLAPIITKKIFEIIRKINKEDQTTIFLVEQNANLALKVADRAYVMETGSITMTDTGENLLARPDLPGRVRARGWNGVYNAHVRTDTKRYIRLGSGQDDRCRSSTNALRSPGRFF